MPSKTINNTVVTTIQTMNHANSLMLGWGKVTDGHQNTHQNWSCVTTDAAAAKKLERDLLVFESLSETLPKTNFVSLSLHMLAVTFQPFLRTNGSEISSLLPTSASFRFLQINISRLLCTSLRIESNDTVDLQEKYVNTHTRVHIYIYVQMYIQCICVYIYVEYRMSSNKEGAQGHEICARALLNPNKYMGCYC